MQLADALLYLVLEAGVPEDELPIYCRDAIRGGVDMIQLGASLHACDRGALTAVAVCCRDEDALLMVGGDASLAAEIQADGVHLDDDLSVGLARAVLPQGLVGVTTSSFQEAQLALEIGADYLLCLGGVAGMAAFSGSREFACVPVYAGGVASLNDAAALVEQGTYRLGLSSRRVPSDGVTAYCAAMSRALGRVM